MPFSVSWHTLLDELEDLPVGSTLITPLSHKPFRITDVQEQRVIIEFEDGEESIPLQRDQFETLFYHIQDAQGGFELDRLPPDADPYPAVLSLHPRFEIDEDKGILIAKDEPTSTQLVTTEPDGETPDRTEPEGLDVYADALLLIDALERHDVSTLNDVETPGLVNLYTLLSDVQRNANTLRQDVRRVLLDRLHHDQPVSGQYGSVQRTSRRNRSLKDDEIVLNALEAAGIDRERVTSVDSSKVDDALDVTELSETDVYEIEETEYVRKAEVHEDVKESRLQGLKDRLAATEDEAAEELQQEIEELEDRIDDLTSFRTGAEMQG